MTIVFQKSILKSKAAKRIVADAKLAYFKEKVLEHLDRLERKEKKKEQAIQKALIEAECLRKAAYPVGTIREWKGKKYIKTAPGKWRRKYDKEGKGAKLAIASLKKKVDACKTSEDLLQLVLEHSDRFRDANGRPLPFVQELSEYVSKANDRLESAKNAKASTGGEGNAKAGGVSSGGSSGGGGGGNNNNGGGAASAGGGDDGGGGNDKDKAGSGGGDDGGKRRGGGSTKGFLFSSLKDNDEKKEELARKINGTIVAEIEADIVPYSRGENFRKAAQAWLADNSQGNAKTVIGDVDIGWGAVKADMNHNKDEGYMKLQTLPVVKDVLEKGTYLGYEKDFNNEPKDNHYFAGKIMYGGKERIVFCRVRKNAGMGNRFYVHEIFTEEEIKANPGNSELSALRDKPLYQFILHDIFTATDRIAQKKKQEQEKKEKEESTRGPGARLARLTESPPSSTLPRTAAPVKQETQKNAGKRDTAKTPDELAQQFGLRGVEISDKVDAKTAQWHVRKCAEGFADLADITGIPDKLISLNGRLALSIGARDKNNASATYSADLRSINISKTRGAGSLSHEWFHAFDNLIQEAMGRYNATPRSFMSQRFLELSDEQAELLRKYLNAPKGSKERKKYKKKSEADGVFGVYLPDEETEEHQIKVLMAFDELAKAMTDGDVAMPRMIRFTAKDEKDAEKWVRADADGIAGEICRAGDFDAAVKIVRERCSRWRDREKWLKIAAAHYRKYSDQGRVTEIDSGARCSAFLREAIRLGGVDTRHEADYWSAMCEMAARAFSAYIKDKLDEQGRSNDYLTRDNNDERVYPQGEERKRINAVFDKLFRVVAETNAIRKALKTTAKKKRWLWVEDGKVWIKKSVMNAWKRAMAEQGEA